jgi:uncharacterized protein YceK
MKGIIIVLVLLLSGCAVVPYYGYTTDGYTTVTEQTRYYDDINSIPTATVTSIVTVPPPVVVTRPVYVPPVVVRPYWRYRYPYRYRYYYR